MSRPAIDQHNIATGKCAIRKHNWDLGRCDLRTCPARCGSVITFDVISPEVLADIVRAGRPHYPETVDVLPELVADFGWESKPYLKSPIRKRFAKKGIRLERVLLQYVLPSSLARIDVHRSCGITAEEIGRGRTNSGQVILLPARQVEGISGLLLPRRYLAVDQQGIDVFCFQIAEGWSSSTSTFRTSGSTACPHAASFHWLARWSSVRHPEES